MAPLKKYEMALLAVSALGLMAAGFGAMPHGAVSVACVAFISAITSYGYRTP